MFFTLSLLWFIRETKAILFWLYLWQLKEYHIGRFLDHFRTERGKQLFWNKLLILKILLVLFFLCGFFLFSFEILPPPVFSKNISLYFFEFFVWTPFLILILYIFEAVHALFSFFQKKLKKPVLTKKTVVLISTGLILEVLFIITLFSYAKDPWGSVNLILAIFGLLIFDILTPIIVSSIVLLFQPVTVLLRNQIIKKAKEKRAQFRNLLVIGITGSYGKTSTKEFLATILAEKFGKDKVLKTKEHQNSEIGISQCILNDLKEKDEIFVVEMGAYNRGGIKLLCDIAKPKIGILTGINEQHMATFGSQENIIQTKFELIQVLPEDGLAVLNYSDERIKNEIKNYNLKLKNIRLCSTEEKTDIWAEDVRVDKEQISFKVFSKEGESEEFKLNLLGAQNVENILLAICCARELGISLTEISKACQEIKSLPHQMELKKGFNGINIIDATYSANPDGVISHLEYLKIWQNKKVIIMPCLIELGKASKEIHKRIGQKIAEVCDLAIITTKDRFKEIREGANEKAIFLENPKEIFEKIKKITVPDDVILLEGRLPIKLINFLIE